MQRRQLEGHFAVRIAINIEKQQGFLFPFTSAIGAINLKARESGMPNEEMWSGFFSPEKILKELGLNKNTKDAADFGCGYGTFTIPAVKIIHGNVYSIDIEPEMIAAVTKKAAEQKLGNVKPILRDFIKNGTGLENESVDYAMLFNILHAEDPHKLLKEAHRILRPGGTLGIIHWNHDPKTPRGPPMEIRPTPEQCIEWAKAAGFELVRQVDLKPYHYGISLKKI